MYSNGEIKQFGGCMYLCVGVYVCLCVYITPACNLDYSKSTSCLNFILGVQVDPCIEYKDHFVNGTLKSKFILSQNVKPWQQYLKQCAS